MMFRAMLRAQWIWSRSIMWFFLAAGFSLPVLTVPMTMRGTGAGSYNAGFVQAGEFIGLLVALTVSLAAVALALQNWSSDERGRHIYALSLPIERHRFLLYRLSGSFVHLGLVALAIWLGGLVATALLELPESLRAYPTSLAVRALLAAWLVHALSCTYFLATGARARLVSFLGVVTVAVLLILPIGTFPARADLLLTGARALVSPHGPLGILVSRWSFIDV